MNFLICLTYSPFAGRWLGVFKAQKCLTISLYSLNIFSNGCQVGLNYLWKNYVLQQPRKIETMHAFLFGVISRPLNVVSETKVAHLIPYG
jgi:hypothetical protein